MNLPRKKAYSETLKLSEFICNTLTNTCGADQTAKNTCATATSAAAAVTPGTGAQADAFNAVFGINTVRFTSNTHRIFLIYITQNFAIVTQVDDQGHVVGATSSTAAATTSPVEVPSAPSTAVSRIHRI